MTSTCPVLSFLILASYDRMKVAKKDCHPPTRMVLMLKSPPRIFFISPAINIDITVIVTFNLRKIVLILIPKMKWMYSFAFRSSLLSIVIAAVVLL